MAEDLRPDIAAAAAASRLGRRRELRELPTHLAAGEEVAALTSGVVGGRGGLLVVTDHRVLFVGKSLRNRAVQEFPFEKITGVASTRSLTMGNVVIYTVGPPCIVEQVARAEAETLAIVIRRHIESRNERSRAHREAAADNPIAVTDHALPTGPPSGADGADTPGVEWLAEEPVTARPADVAAATPPVGAGQVVSIAAELRALAELRDDGILTEEEFAAQKAKLLGR
jgi:hypothetical protein